MTRLADVAVVVKGRSKSLRWRQIRPQLNLDQAAEGYKNFDDRLDGWTKVLLHP